MKKIKRAVALGLAGTMAWFLLPGLSGTNSAIPEAAVSPQTAP